MVYSIQSLGGGGKGKNNFASWSELVKYEQESFILSLTWHVSLAGFLQTNPVFLLAMPWQPGVPTMISIHDLTKDEKK